MNFLICCMNDVYALDGKLIRKQTNDMGNINRAYMKEPYRGMDYHAPIRLLIYQVTLTSLS